jgi:hypothetical protein
VGLLLASPAQALGFGHHDLISLSALEDGLSFDSKDGEFTFSDFDFTALDFDESALDIYFIRPIAGGFRLMLGFVHDFFGPGNLEISYTVTANGSNGITQASIPLLGVLDLAPRSDPLLQVDWEGSNGASLYAEATRLGGFPGVSTDFVSSESIQVEELLSLSGRVGIAKLENTFSSLPSSVPEPTTGALMVTGLMGLVLAGRPRTARS